jgi:hypothetical protein
VTGRSGVMETIPVFVFSCFRQRFLLSIISKRVGRIIRIQGVKDSSKMLENDRELKVWQRFYRPGDLGHIERECLKG